MAMIEKDLKRTHAVRILKDRAIIALSKEPLADVSKYEGDERLSLWNSILEELRFFPSF